MNCVVIACAECGSSRMPFFSWCTALWQAFYRTRWLPALPHYSAADIVRDSLRGSIVNRRDQSRRVLSRRQGCVSQLPDTVEFQPSLSCNNLYHWSFPNLLDAPPEQFEVLGPLLGSQDVTARYNRNKGRPWLDDLQFWLKSNIHIWYRGVVCNYGPYELARSWWKLSFLWAQRDNHKWTRSMKCRFKQARWFEWDFANIHSMMIRFNPRQSVGKNATRPVKL